MPDCPSYQHILFCSDFSENADHAFGFALDACLKRPDSTLTILHVIPEPDAQFWKTYIYEVDNIDQKAKDDIDAKIQAAYLEHMPATVKCEVRMQVGSAASEILKYAKTNGVDLIVLGRQGKSTLGKILGSGSVTKKVATHSPCPVLIVPMPAQTQG
jgi:nucleotide-binding universal stress UspA family protein